MPFKLFQLNRAKWIHFTEQNCSTEIAVVCLFLLFLISFYLFLSYISICVHIYPFFQFMCLYSGAHWMASCAPLIWVFNQVNSERAVAVGWNSCGSQAQFFLDLWNGLFREWRDISQNQFFFYCITCFFCVLSLLLSIFQKWTRKYLNVFLLVLEIMLYNNLINLFQRNWVFPKVFCQFRT